MLTDPKLRSQMDALWDKLWSGGLPNHLNAIEQLTYLIFLKRLDDEENRREQQALRRGLPFVPRVPEEMRWRDWKHKQGPQMLKHLKDKVFPWLRELGGKHDQEEQKNSFELYMENVEFLIDKPNILVEACSIIDQMNISAQNQDIQGDLYEYLLSKLETAGRNGQFRTPRHIIRMMVQMIGPRAKDRIGDLAAGTCGFLVNAYQYILEQNTSPDVLEYDEEGMPHHLLGDKLTKAEEHFLQTKALRGYDNDSGKTILRIGSMNLILHGIEHPRFFYMDTLSKAYNETAEYDVILMNPPFKGAIDKGDIHTSLPDTTTKTELLFLHLILRALDMGGRCAVIVPDGVLFGSSNAHVDIRKKIIEQNRLDGVVSMPSGVFKPYAGVSTAVLIFTRGATTDRIWFYDMAHDGFSLDDKRQPVAENDIPDILQCWHNRHNPAFLVQRQQRLDSLKAEVLPLKTERLRLQGDINRLRFESVIANGDGAIPGELEAAETRLAELRERIAPLQAEIDRLSRQFWVTRQQVKANKYDLSASRYRQVESDDAFYESPQVTMERLLRLEKVMEQEIRELGGMLA